MSIKKIIEKFFEIIYKKPNSFSNDYKILKTKINYKKKKFFFKIFKIKFCSVFTDTLYNVTYIKNQKILKKISIQLDHQGFYLDDKYNQVLKKGTTKLRRKIKGPILSLIQGASGHNYFHFLFDIVPKILIVKKKFKLKYFNYFYLPEVRYKFQNQILKSIGINKKKFLNSKKIRHIETNEMIVPQHPYYNDKHWWKKFEKIPVWIVKLLINKFIKLKKKTVKIKNIYIDRTDTNNTHNQIYNEKELNSLLKSFNFTKIKLANFSFFEQIYLFNNAKHIIGPHGAGFANLIFCKKNTMILEIKDKSFKLNMLYKRISKICNLKYIAYTSNKNFNQKMYIDIKKIKKIIIQNFKL